MVHCYRILKNNNSNAVTATIGAAEAIFHKVAAEVDDRLLPISKRCRRSGSLWEGNRSQTHDGSMVLVY